MSFCAKCGQAMKCTSCVDVPLSGKQDCPLKKGAIWVQVVDDLGAPVKGCSITVGGTTKATDDAGFVHYDPLDDTAHEVDAVGPIPASHLDTHSLPLAPKVSCKVNKGEITFHKFKLENVNIVTPKIEVEYKVVLLERELAKHLGSDKVYAEPTRVELSFTQTNPAHPYELGGKFKCDPAKVEVYLDEACTKKLTGDLTKDQLKADSTLLLYLKGVTAGAFSASLELEDPAKPLIKRKDNPAEQAMAVVAVELELYGDKKAHSKVFFDTTALTRTKLSDADKIAKGRIVQTQDGGKHARAKLVVKKPDALWTFGQDDYKLVLRKAAASGDVQVFKAETGGAPVALPLDLAKSDLAADLTLWVEGAGASSAMHSVRLLLDLDRAAGGLAFTAKKNGDLAMFTVAEFAKITPETDDYKQYVNLPEEGAHPEYGRELIAKAKLTTALENVEIMFSLIPASANTADIPPNTKHVPPKDLDVAVKTNSSGEADSGKLKLSAYGGDKFQVAAYLVEAPPPGDAAPSKSLSKALEIWRQLYYRVACMKRADNTLYSNRLDEAAFKTNFDDLFVKFSPVGTVQSRDFQAVVKDNQIAAWNGATFGADQARTLNIGLIEAQTSNGATEVERIWAADSDYDGSLLVSTETLSKFTLDLSSTAEWLESAWYRDTDVSPADWHAVAASQVSLVLAVLDHKLKVDLTGVVPGIAIDKIELKVKVKILDEWSGDRSGSSILIGMRWREIAHPSDVMRAALQTMLHEAGHYLGMAPAQLANTALGANTQQYQSNGPHCNFGTDQCTMYHAFGFVFDFCATCGGSLKARDMTAPPLSSTAAY